MRKLLVLMLAVGLVAPLTGEASGARKTRSDSAKYDATPTRGGFTSWFGGEYGIYFGDGVTFETKRREKTVTLTVLDDSGNDVAAVAWQNDRDYTIFCSRSKPFRIIGGRPLFVQPMIDLTPGAAVCPTPALTTTGTVRARFH